MPIVLSSPIKFSFTEAQLRNIIELLNVSAHLFDIKSFQTNFHKLIGTNSFPKILDFLSCLDSTSLSYFQSIIRCPSSSASDIAIYLTGEDIETNYLNYYKFKSSIVYAPVVVSPYDILTGAAKMVAPGIAVYAPAIISAPGLPPAYSVAPIVSSGRLLPSPVFRGPSAEIVGNRYILRF